MKAVSLLLSPFVAAMALPFLACVKGAVLPEKMSGIETLGAEELTNLKHFSNPLSSSIDSTIGLPKNDLAHTNLLYTLKFLIEYLRDFQSTRSTRQGNTILEDLFKGVSNDNCKGHILEWLIRIGGNNDDIDLYSDKEKWVLQMVDSWGKLPEGILSGHINSLGDFDECIDMEVKDLDLLNSEFTRIPREFEGRYCTAYLVDYNSTMMAAGRLPVLETEDEKPFITTMGSQPGLQEAVSVKELISMLYTQVGLSILMPSIALCMPNSCNQTDIHAFFTNALLNVYTELLQVDPTTMIYPLVATCRVKEKPDYAARDIAMITILSIFAGVSLLAGVLDYWQRHQKGDIHRFDGKAYKYLMAFSIYTNIKKCLSTRKSAEDLGCLHGIRFLSTCWVVLGHSYVVFGSVPQWNMVDLANLHKAWTMMPIINGTFSVDTFFVMSGVLATYNILKMLDKTNGRFNVIMFYIHRYIRLTPTYLILIGIMATLVVYMGNGPSWVGIEMQAEYCRKNWWTNILYINNIVNTKEMCNGESWYLANEKMPLLFSSRLTDGFFQIYYRPWSRIQTFLVGIWLGWVLHKTRGKRVNLSPIIVGVLWISSTILAVAVIYPIKEWFDPKYEIPETPAYFYAALSRFSWGLVVAWVIFACVKGYGGIINSFLSWKAFMPLGRLTFCVYLVSMHLQMIMHFRMNVPMKYETYTMVNLFISHMVVSLMVGFVFTVLFESPFITLQKLIFDGGVSGKPQLRPKKTDHGDSIKPPSKRYGIFYEKEDTIISPYITPDVAHNEKEAKD